MGDLSEQVLVMWLFITSLYVFFMQIGFCLVEVGSVHRKHSTSVVAKNMCTVVVAVVSFWLFGYGLGYGCSDDCIGFVGDDDFLLSGFAQTTESDSPIGFLSWFFRFAFAMFPCMIISGGVAERCSLQCYLAFTLVVAGFIHPVSAHWVWGGGWLQSRGVIDTAGAGVVSVLGGVGGLVGSVILGPRFGHFEGPRFRVRVRPSEPFSPVFHALGVFIVWTGWYGLNVGACSPLQGRIRVVQLIAVNTTLAPSIAALTTMALSFFCSPCGPSQILEHHHQSQLDAQPKKQRRISCDVTFNGVLGGLTAIGACCAVVSPWASCVIGVVGGALHFFVGSLLRQLRVDDPVGVCGVSFVCGLWGLIATGLFAEEDRVDLAFAGEGKLLYGLFMGGGGKLLGWQLLYAVCVMVWSLVTCAFVFTLCSFCGIGRVSREVENYGLDAVFQRVKDKRDKQLEDLINAALGHKTLKSNPDPMLPDGENSQPTPGPTVATLGVPGKAPSFSKKSPSLPQRSPGLARRSPSFGGGGVELTISHDAASNEALPRSSMDTADNSAEPLVDSPALNPIPAIDEVSSLVENAVVESSAMAETPALVDDVVESSAMAESPALVDDVVESSPQDDDPAWQTVDEQSIEMVTLS